MYHVKQKPITKKRKFQKSFTKHKVQVSLFRDKWQEINQIPWNLFSCFLKYNFATERHFIAESILGISHSQTNIYNNIYNKKFILMRSNWSRPYDRKIRTFYFLRISELYRKDSFWYHGQFQLFKFLTVMKNIF